MRKEIISARLPFGFRKVERSLAGCLVDDFGFMILVMDLIMEMFTACLFLISKLLRLGLHSDDLKTRDFRKSNIFGYPEIFAVDTDIGLY
jgi:hypothetical protein